MVDRFVSKPIELPADADSVARADLIFYGIDHSRESFEARIFFDDPKVRHKAGVDHPTYVESFYIFGHGGCFGDVGHCDIPKVRDPFDLRPPHQLLPAQRIVTVTDKVRELIELGTSKFTVTVIAHTPGESSNKVLAFDTVRLAIYA